MMVSHGGKYWTVDYVDPDPPDPDIDAVLATSEHTLLFKVSGWPDGLPEHEFGGDAGDYLTEQLMEVVHSGFIFEADGDARSDRRSPSDLVPRDPAFSDVDLEVEVVERTEATWA